MSHRLRNYANDKLFNYPRALPSAVHLSRLSFTAPLVLSSDEGDESDRSQSSLNYLQLWERVHSTAGSRGPRTLHLLRLALTYVQERNTLKCSKQHQIRSKWTYEHWLWSVAALYNRGKVAYIRIDNTAKQKLEDETIGKPFWIWYHEQKKPKKVQCSNFQSIQN